MYTDDQIYRKKALNPQESFIIQAPAGSGKTEVLTQRFLRLLASVHNGPEEIIAITFTRKAASEMRTRILSALKNARSQIAPTAKHEQITWELAKQALEQDQKYNWEIEKNPNRLRIMTIDSLSAMLTHQIPLLSGFSVNPSIIEDASPYYEKATLSLLSNAENKPWQSDLEQLIMHLDNNTQHLVDLCIHLLACREQWLPHIMHHHKNTAALKGELEIGLLHILEENIAQVNMHFKKEHLIALINMIHLFSANIPNDTTHPLFPFKNMQNFPTQSTYTTPIWKSLSHLLLTKNGEWRKSLDKRLGFPAQSTIKDPDEKKQTLALKQALLDLIQSLSENHALHHSLQALHQSPPTQYEDHHWKTIEALVNILPLLVAELNVSFLDAGVIDFIEVTLGALRALGEPEAPTDLALYLDYQIKHLLIDEFQDTSILQFNLLKRLISEWQPNEGRTLFFVGDPMQSIYRFRNAEVGLFLHVKENGIANIMPTSLTLHKNFRSDKKVISWVNAKFQDIFPTTPNSVTGAIPFYPAIATQSFNNTAGVFYYPINNHSKKNEVARIEKIINHIIQKNKNESIAILVRSRSQLSQIIPYLQQSQIDFQAIDIQPLMSCPDIQDLFTLTCALTHLGDQLSWLALLRAPWCGLTLDDILTLVKQSQQKPLWAALKDFSNNDALSLDGKSRLKRMIPLLQSQLENRSQIPLSEWVENTWHALGGVTYLRLDSELNNCKTFFSILSEFDSHFSRATFKKKLMKSFASSSNSNHNLHIMTIHKSKGLEFDHIIIPSCDHAVRSNLNKLLLWLEKPSIQGSNDLILAPIQTTHHTHNPINQYIKSSEKEKLDYETSRLFYVAITRARQSVHLLFSVSNDADNSLLNKPARGSFLNLIWDNCANDITANIVANTDNAVIVNQRSYNILKRIPLSWEPFITIESLNKPSLKNSITTYQLANEYKRILGTFLHERLAEIADEGLHHWDQDKIFAMHPCWIKQLGMLGIEADYIPKSVSQINDALIKMLADPRGRWLLTKHPDAHSEYPLSAHIESKLVNIIIDRTFKEANTRWIIDYKMSKPNKDESLTEFLEKQQEIYIKQLEQYAILFSLKENIPIKLALYFPLCKGWIAWKAHASTNHVEKVT